jgi:hypothetical protein
MATIITDHMPRTGHVGIILKTKWFAHAAMTQPHPFPGARKRQPGNPHLLPNNDEVKTVRCDASTLQRI